MIIAAIIGRVVIAVLLIIGISAAIKFLSKTSKEHSNER